MHIQGQLIQMSQSMQLSLFMALELTTSDSAAHTIFPEVEEWLEDSDRRNAIEMVASRKNAGKYRSVIDFLSCEINPELKKLCFKFYLSGKEEDMFGCIFDGLMRDRYAARVLIALEIAYQAYKAERVLSWTAMVICVDEIEQEVA